MKKVWITWEQQRRSVELANAFGCTLFVLNEKFLLSNVRVVRYVKLCFETVAILLKNRPKIVFAQNPSILLAFVLCLLKGLFCYKLFVDRHSNFKLQTIDSREITWRIFHFMSRFTIKRADLTIVTNDVLMELVAQWGGRGYVLQDKLPVLDKAEPVNLGPNINVVFIASFSGDEPIQDVIEAASILGDEYSIYITGRYQRMLCKADVDGLPKNVMLTGYLVEAEYQSIIASADILLVLTMQDFTLTCGAYEGIVLKKPLIVSDTASIREYFSMGVVYSKCDSKSIESSVRYAYENKDALSCEILQLADVLRNDWDSRFNELSKSIGS